MRTAMRLGFAQREHGAAGVRQNAVDGAVAGEALEQRVRARAEYDEAGVAFRSPGENLDAGVSVDHVRFDLDPTCGARIGGKVAEFLEYKRVEAGGLGVAVCIFC